jgi:hypothetical protein
MITCLETTLDLWFDPTALKLQWQQWHLVWGALLLPGPPLLGQGLWALAAAAAAAMRDVFLQEPLAGPAAAVHLLFWNSWE